MNLSQKTFNALAQALGPEGIGEATEIDGLLGGTAFTGDVIVTNDVAAVQPTKLASGELTAIVTDAGTKTLIAAAANARNVLVTVNVTTVFATGDGAQPTLSIGQTGSVSKFAATSIFVSAAAGATFTFGGILTGGDALIATQVAGTGTTETGAYTITAIAVG